MKKRENGSKRPREPTDDPATKDHGETGVSRDIVYMKIDPKGQFVDMRVLPKKELKALLIFYEGKLKRVRHRDMKRAYDQ